MEMSGRADPDNLVLATVLGLGVPLEDKRYQQWLTQRCSPSMDNGGPYHAYHLPYLIDQGAGLPLSSHRKREGRGAVGLLRHGSSFRRAHSSLNAIDCPQCVSACCPFMSPLPSPLSPLPSPLSPLSF